MAFESHRELPSKLCIRVRKSWIRCLNYQPNHSLTLVTDVLCHLMASFLAYANFPCLECLASAQGAPSRVAQWYMVAGSPGKRFSHGIVFQRL